MTAPLPVLSQAYAIERELGGGGMSRVFLATETALGRRVVIKLLPQELAGGVNADRFRNEIQLQARLQHPLLVPLLATGETQGQLWYVMPYIEGVSLKERLEQGPVPAEDALRWLTDVSEALAYAHERGVVHRDVKPANVLLTAGRAVVTDFGVAKAVRDAASTGADAGLTSLGVALGTPAYIAPEQAAADPNVDHRADLYALGCMAYELFTGKPPFHGLPAAQLLAAHIATPPKPLAALRPDLPPAVSALVMQLLAKRPEDRPATAAAVAKQFAREAGGSGATAAVTAPLMTLPLQAAARAIGVPLVLFGYAIGASLLTGGLKGIAMSTGLPDWALRGAYGLVALAGLVLVAGTFGLLPRLRFKAFVVGTLAAFGLLGGSAAAWGALREAGVGPMASLTSSGKLGERERVLIADFANRSGDSTITSVVTEAFRTDFTQSRAIRVLSGEQVTAALTRMQRAPGTRLDAALARELAQREGIKAIVEGDIQKLGTSWLVAARLVEAKTGEVLAAYRETASDDGALIGAIDKLSKELREKIGESMRTIRGDGALEEVTTASLPALRKYSEAMRLGNATTVEAFQREVALLKEAVALDSTFAMAWRRLGVLTENQGTDRAPALRALTRAYELRERLSPRERLLAEAAYATYVQRDRQAAIRAYEGVLALVPDDYIALNNVTREYEQVGDRARVMAGAARLIAMDSTRINAWAWLINGYYAQGQTAEARRLRGAFSRRFGQTFYGVRLQVQWLQYEQQLDSAEALLRAALVSTPRADAEASTLLSNLSGLLAIRGRFAESRRLGDELVPKVLAFDSSYRTVIQWQTLQDSIWRSIWWRQDVPGTLRLIETITTGREYRALPPRWQNRDYIAWMYALAGQPSRSVPLLQQYVRDRMAEATELTRPSIVRDVAQDVRATAAWVLAAQGNVPAALDSLRLQLRDTPSSTAATRCAMGLIAAQQLPDSALVWLQSALTERDPERRVEAAVWCRLPALEQSARLLEARGDTRSAVAAYREIVTLWAKADPAYQFRVRAAAEALRRLGEEK